MRGYRRLNGTAPGDVRLVLDASREAEGVLEQEARLHPSFADIRHRRGLLRLARGEFEGAQREFEDALGIHPGYRAAYYGLRLTMALRGRVPDSEPEQPPAGTAAREEGCWACVDAAYRRRLAGQDPRPALEEGDCRAAPLLPQLYTAVFALLDADPAATAELLTAAAETSAVTREVLERAAVLPWSEEGRASAAEQLGSLLWTPLAADLYIYLGRIYASHGLRREALECFDRAYLVFPREAEHALHQAEIATAAGDEQAAIEMLSLAIARDPACVEAHIALGFEYAAQGFADDATRSFSAAARLAPEYADVRYNLGLLHVHAERHEEALAEFQRALRINRSYLPARHSMAALLCRLGRHAEGLLEYERLLRHGFQSADMLAQMGRAALALGRTDEALQYLERARHLNPDYILTHYYLGRAYRRKGLRNKARSAWRRYLEGAAEWQPQLPAADLDEDLGGVSS